MPPAPPQPKFPAVVAFVLDEYKVVINRGRDDGIILGQRFLIYELSKEEIIDPVTKQTLGYLEIVKGTGKVAHLQDTMATIESDRKEPPRKVTIKRRPEGIHVWGGEEEEETTTSSTELLPFDDPSVGDKAKPV